MQSPPDDLRVVGLDQVAPKVVKPALLEASHRLELRREIWRIREITATVIALGVFLLVALNVSIPLVSPMVIQDTARLELIRSASEQALPGLTALMGAVIGAFYFGEHRRSM